MKQSILCALLIFGVSNAFAGLQVQGEAVKPAAPKKKVTQTKKTPTSKVTVETYPAIEDVTYDDEPIVEIGTKPVQVESPSVTELESSAKAKAMEERIALLEKRLGETVKPAAISAPAPAAPVAAKAEVKEVKTEAKVAAPAVPAASSEKYFSVNNEKRDQVIARLKFIEALIRESGRAYDYRGMTSAQLQAELRSIRAAQTQKASAPAPVKTAPAAAPQSEDPSKTPSDVLKIIFSE